MSNFERTVTEGWIVFRRTLGKLQVASVWGVLGLTFYQLLGIGKTALSSSALFLASWALGFVIFGVVALLKDASTLRAKSKPNDQLSDSIVPKWCQSSETLDGFCLQQLYAARSFEAKGQNEEALRVFEDLVTYCKRYLPKNIEALPYLGIALVNRGNSRFVQRCGRKAILDWDEALTILPKNTGRSTFDWCIASALTNKGIQLKNFRHWDEAAHVLDEVITEFAGLTNPRLLDPLIRAFVARASLAMRNGEFERAHSLFDSALTLFYSSKEEIASNRGLNELILCAWCGTGQIETSTGHYVKAILAFENVWRLRTSVNCDHIVTIARMWQAYCFSRSKHYVGALKIYETVSRLVQGVSEPQRSFYEAAVSCARNCLLEELEQWEKHSAELLESSDVPLPQTDELSLRRLMLNVAWRQICTT
jgi:tetratricopeptide (TPR) repeat protein